VPCAPIAGLTHVAQVAPPPGAIRGFDYLDCGSNIRRSNRVVQLWRRPSSGNRGGTFVAETTTNAEGYFSFEGLDPCLAYEVKFVQGTLTVVVPVVYATTDEYEYIFSDTTGAVCDVLVGYPHCYSDIDLNGLVNILDLTAVTARFGTQAGQAGYATQYDLNRDGFIDTTDIQIVISQWGNVC
jgi:hypothetical protein